MIHCIPTCSASTQKSLIRSFINMVLSNSENGIAPKPSDAYIKRICTEKFKRYLYQMIAVILMNASVRPSVILLEYCVFSSTIYQTDLAVYKWNIMNAPTQSIQN